MGFEGEKSMEKTRKIMILVVIVLFFGASIVSGINIQLRKATITNIGDFNSKNNFLDKKTCKTCC